MRADICRIHIINILNFLDDYENEHDKILTAQLICKFVFGTDILYDKYSDCDRDFLNFFGKKLLQLYTQYPTDFEKYMNEYDDFIEDMESLGGNSSDSSDSDFSIEYV